MKRKMPTAAPKRSLDIAALEPRVLMSAAPLPADVAIVENDAATPGENLDATQGATSQDGDFIFSDSEVTGTDATSGSDSDDNTGFIYTDDSADILTQPVDLNVQPVFVTAPNLPVDFGEIDNKADLRKELVFVDAGIDGLNQMLQDLWANDDPSKEIEVVLLSSGSDGIEQITRTLASRTDLDAIHIVSHGSEGQVQLGNTSLNSANFDAYQQQIASWSNSLNTGAELLLYGCDLAGSAAGRELINSIGATCDCDVAASDDLTGAASLGGDWDLEYSTGEIETSVAFSSALQVSWQGTLDITSNLVAHYELESTAGGVAEDSTANANDGTLINGPTASVDAAVGSGSYDFGLDGAGSNAVVSVPDDPALDFSGDFSISFWYNASMAQDDSTRLIGSHDGSNGFSIFADSDGSLNVFLDDGSSFTNIGDSDGLVADGSWHHVAVVRNSGAVSLYVDNTTAGSTTFAGALTPAAPLTIGGESATVSDYEGKLDDVRVYSRALSNSDVTELYNFTGSSPQTFTVTNTNDSGAGSLRQAIIDANASVGADTIDFNIAGTGSHVITLSSALDNITDEVSIDAMTDDSFAANGNAPAIIIDGEGLVGSGFIFESAADNSSIEGLVIRDFAGNGITLFGGADNITIQGNYIGSFDSSGNDAGDGEENTGYGIYVGGANAIIGGTSAAARNVVSGNFAGIVLDGGGTNGAVVTGNYIGTNAAGNLLIGHESNGIIVSNGASGNTIGGTAAGEGNVIVASGLVDGSDGAGVSIQGASAIQNTIRGNSIHSNAGLGIDLSAATDDGVTANDSGDGDSGGNSLQNWAVLTSAAIADDGNFTYDLDTTTLASGSYTVDFYASTNRDGGRVEGERYIGTAFGVNGGGSWSGAIGTVTLEPGEFITLVTTDSSGNSSEFSTYAMAMDGDGDGVSPEDIKTTATTGGGLSINADAGDDIYLVADESPFNNNQSEVTIEVEYSSSTAATGVTTLFSYADQYSGDEVFFGIEPDGELIFRTSGGTSTAGNSITTAANLFDGQKHTVAVTWENSGGILKFYVDGEELGLGRNSYQDGTTISNSGTFVLGNRQGTPEASFDSNDTFSGTLYNVRVFDHVRTDEQLAASYQTELPYDESGMLAQWRFDELSSDGVVTESVSGNNLTVKHTLESGFTASEASLTFAVDENAVDGTVVGSVYGVDPQREAQISALLTADADLRYNAETGKFYKISSAQATYAAAESNAIASALNTVSGQLVTIRNAAEQEFVTDLANGSAFWLGAQDVTVEGEWRWQNSGVDSDLFWNGDGNGYNVEGAYTNWLSGQPDGSGNQARVRNDGTWDDQGSGDDLYIIEWSADAVLDATQAITYDITSQTVAGAFEIDADTGQIRVLDGTMLDADTQATHTITVQVSDGSNTYDEDFTVSLNNLVEDNNAPTNLSSGIELNTDGGNDAYLGTTAELIGNLDAVTIEATFAIDASSGASHTLIDFYSTAGIADELTVVVHNTGRVEFAVGDVSQHSTEFYTSLLDGNTHHVAVSWDSNGGNWALYIDGELGETRTGLRPGVSLATGTTLSIGQSFDDAADSDAGLAFSGTLYDIRLWGEVRSEAEISLNYQHKVDSGSLPGGLIANWQMDGFDGSNEVVDVVSGNNLSVRGVTGTPILNWTNQVGGVTASGDTLTFVDDADPNGWTSQINSAALSTYGFTDDYTVSFTLDNVTNYGFFVGLGETDSGPDTTDVDQGIFFSTAIGDDVGVYQNGVTSQPAFAVDYVAGDEFSFYINGTTLEFQHNGTTFHTETITASTDWYIDTSFFQDDGTFDNQDDYSLSNFRVFGGNSPSGSFIASTPVEDLHIGENATDGATVGYVVPTDPESPQDVVSDGSFLSHSMAGTFEQVSSGNPIGDWTVTQNTAVIYNDPAIYDETPLNGRPLELGMSSGPAAIEQTLTTEVGRQYQIVFALSGDWGGGDAAKTVRVSAAGVSDDFSMTEPNNWSTSNRLWDQRSMTFVADSTSTTISLESLVSSIPQYNVVVGDVQVIEIPQAVSTILNNDPTLTYDAATDKFYRISASSSNWSTANSAAQSAELNGVSGQLVTIRSAYENELVRSSLMANGDIYAWLGATDATSEGEFRWQEGGADGDLFWSGGLAGSATAGEYSNFRSGEPNDSGGNEDHVNMRVDSGLWIDQSGSIPGRYIIEWDASEVLSNYTFSLTDDAGGRFAIDSNTGQVTVADASLIDYETATSHDIDVQTTDAAGNSYSEAMTIEVDNAAGDAALTIPIAQSVDEDTPLTFSVAGGNAISLESGSPNDTIVSATLSVDNGTLTLSTTANIAFLNGTSDGTASLSISGTESAINTALDGLQYDADLNYNGADTLTFTTGSPAVTEANLYARYEFDSGLLSDASGNGYDGTGVGDPILTRDPQRGDVLTFDGTDRVTVTGGTSGLGDAVTISAWVNLDAGQQDNVFLSIGDDFYVTLDESNASRSMSIFANGYTTGSLSATNNIAGEGWNHVAATLDDVNKVVILYLNGEEIRRGTFSFSDIDWGVTGSPDISIGARTDGSNAFNGSLEDVRLYDRVLTESEINAVLGDQGYATEDVAITVDPVNDAPTFNNLDGNLAFIENGAAVVLDADVEIFDTELSEIDDFSGATLTLARNGGASAEDQLVFDGTNVTVSGANVSVGGTQVGTYTFTGGELAVTFGANATNARVNTLMQNILYSNSSHVPPASVQIDWTFNDGNAADAQGSGPAETATGSTTVDIIGVEGGISVSINDPGAFGLQSQASQTLTSGDATYLSQAVALNNDGSYVLVWASSDDGSGQGVYSRRYDPLGNPIGPETRGNTTTTNDQNYASVAMDDAGNYVVVWQGEGPGDTYGVFGQRFDANGVAQGSEFLVNTTTTGNQNWSSVAMDADGDFVVVWNGEGAGDTAGVFMQRFDASGVAQGTESLVHTTTAGNQDHTDVAMDSDGNITVTWSSNGQDGSGRGVYVRRFDADGTAITGEIQVDADTSGSQWISQIDVNDSGDFVVVWRDDGAADTIQAQLFNADGSKNGGEIIVSDRVESSDNYPTVQMDNDGNFVVVWEGQHDGNDYGIVARRFDSSGTALGASFVVNTTTAGIQEYPAISMNDSGQFVIAFEDFTAGTVESRVYGLTTTESGGTASVDVVLDMAPTDDVTIAVSMPDGTEGTLSTALLTFTSVNWNVAQTVTITGASDSLNDGNIQHLLVFDPASSTDLNYNGLDLNDLVVSNEDHNPLVDLDADDSVGSGVDFSVTYVENATPTVIVDSDATISDPDSSNLNSLLVTITNQLDGANEILAADTTGTSITASYTGGVLTLSGSDTIANYQQVLRTVTYENTAIQPDLTDRSITFVTNDGTHTNEVATTTLSITAVNDAPVLDGSPVLQLDPVNEDSGSPVGAVGTLVSSLVDFATPSGQQDNVTDVDNSSTGIAVIQASAGVGTWYYSVDNGSNWIGMPTVNSGSALLLAADANTRLYFEPDPGFTGQAANALRFHAWDQTSGSNGSQVDVSINGGSTAFSSATDYASVVVSPVNDDPVVDDGGTYTINEGNSLNLDASGTTDVDSGTLTYRWDLDNDGGYDDLITTNANETVTWSTLYGLGVDDDGLYTIGLQVDDGDGGVSTSSTSLTINNVAPTLTATGAATTAGDASYTLTLTDVDPGNDTVSSWIVNWGDGAIDTYAGDPASVTHTYANDLAGLTLDITVSAIDEDGQYFEAILLAPAYVGDNVSQFEGYDGTPLGTFAPLSDGVNGHANIVVTPSGNYLVSGVDSGNIVEYQPDGTLVGDLVAASDTNLSSPGGLAYGPDGNLYVADYGAGQIVRFDGATGAYIDDFVASGLTNPLGMQFGPDGDLYVANRGSAGVLRYDGTTGVLDASFTVASISGVEDLTFGPDGNVYVGGTDGVTQVNATTGATTLFIANGTGGLTLAAGVDFGPDGSLYVGDQDSDVIRRYNGTTGAYIDDYATGIDGPAYMEFTADHQVTVTNSNQSPVIATNTGATILEGSLNNTITTAMLNEGDPDDGGAELTYTLTADVSYGTLELNGSAIGLNDTFTQADIDAGLVTYDHGGGEFATDSFDFSLADGGENGSTPASGTFNFTVTNVNDAPVESSIEVAALAYAENDGAVAITSTLAISDVDDTNIESAVVQITGGYNSGEDVLSFVDQNGIGGSYDSASGTWTLTGPATLAQYETAIRSITYTNTSENPDVSTRTVSITVNDGDANSNTLTRDIAIEQVNDTPDVAGPGSAYTVNEQTNQNIHGTGFSVSDIDAASGTMTATFVVGEGALSLTAGDSGVLITANNAGTVAFTGTLAEINALLTGGSSGTIVYNNASDTPSTSTSITLTVNDGGNTGSDPGLTADGTSEEDSASQTINITAVQDAPVIANLGGDTLNYNEGDGQQAIDQSADAAVTDIDSSDFDTGTLTVSFIAGSDNAEDVLSIINTGTGAGEIGVSGSNITYEGATIGAFTGGSSGISLVITLNPNADATTVSALIQSVSYENKDTDSPTTGDRTVRFVLTDGDGATSANYDTTINFSEVNDTPMVSLANTTTTLSEDTDTSSAIKVADIVISDDATGTNTLSLTGADAALFEIVGTELRLVAGASLDFETNDTLDVTVLVDDAAVGGSPDDTAPLAIAVTDVNEAPMVSLANTTTTISEDTDTSSAIKVADIVISDDATGTNTLSVTGADAALFEIVGTELRLVAGASLDFETNDTLDVTVQVDDAAVGGSPDDTAPLAIAVTDVNEAPMVSLANTTTTISEDTDTSSAIKVADIVISDDATGTNTLSLTGADAALFEIVGTELRLVAGASLDHEANGTLDVTVQVDDAAVGGSPDDTAPLAIAVTDVNEAPMVTLANTTTTISEDTDTSSAIKVADIVISDDATGTNTLSLTGADAALFEIVGTELRLVAGASLDFETNDTLDVTVQVDDAAVGGSPDDTAPLAIAVSNVNEAPVNSTPAAQMVAEDGSLAFSVADGTAITVSDVDASSLEVTLTASNGLLTLDGTTGLTLTTGDGSDDGTIVFTGSKADINAALDGLIFAPDTNYNGAASLQIVTSDLGASGSGGVLTDSDTISITVDAQNDAPQLAAPATEMVAEDSALVFSTAGGNDISISDVDAGGAPLTITLSVANGALTLAGTAGLSFSTGDGTADASLTFTGNTASINAALDGLSYTPGQDFNGNVALNMMLSDNGNTGSGGVLMAAGSVNITVTPVNDAPVGQSSSFNGTQNQTLNVPAPGVLSGASDVEGDALTAVLVSGPSSGSLSLNSDGSFTYNPAFQFTGAVTFTYRINDGADNSTVYSVQLAIDPVVAPPPTPIDPVDPADDPADDPTDESPDDPDSTPSDPAPEEEITSEDDSQGNSLPVGGNGGRDGSGFFSSSLGESTQGDAASSELDSVEVAMLSVREYGSDSSSPATLRRGSDYRDVEYEEFSIREIDQFQRAQETLSQNAFREKLDKIREDANLTRNVSLGAATAVTSVASIGYLIWTVRGGYLLASMVSALPAWRMIDPVAVLNDIGPAKEADGDEESLQSMVEEQTGKES